jgi:hypothetical protein
MTKARAIATSCRCPTESCNSVRSSQSLGCATAPYRHPGVPESVVEAVVVTLRGKLEPAGLSYPTVSVLEEPASPAAATGRREFSGSLDFLDKLLHLSVHSGGSIAAVVRFYQHQMAQSAQRDRSWNTLKEISVNIGVPVIGPSLKSQGLPASAAVEGK